AELVGRNVDALEVGSESEHDAAIDDEELFDSLPTDDGRKPLLLTGTAQGPRDEPPPELLVAINGRLAGVVGGYQPDGDGWDFAGYVEDLYQDGRNEVRL